MSDLERQIREHLAAARQRRQRYRQVTDRAAAYWDLIDAVWPFVHSPQDLAEAAKFILSRRRDWEQQP